MSTISMLQAHLSPYYKLPYINRDQNEYLESVFTRNKNPRISDLVIMAAEIGMPLNDIKVWFENRLAFWRRAQGLPANWKHITD